jgi:hypothetical protein
MIFTAAGLVNEGAIDFAVRKVEREFSPDVVRIIHSFEQDSNGYPAVFFRIVVRDESAPVAELLRLSRRISVALMNEARTDENDLRAYFNYRSVSEQQKLQDPACE